MTDFSTALCFVLVLCHLATLLSKNCAGKNSNFLSLVAGREQRDNLHGYILIIKIQWYKVELCSFIYERSAHSEVIVLKPASP